LPDGDGRANQISPVRAKIEIMPIII